MKAATEEVCSELRASVNAIMDCMLMNSTTFCGSDFSIFRQTMARNKPVSTWQAQPHPPAQLAHVPKEAHPRGQAI